MSSCQIHQTFALTTSRYDIIENKMSTSQQWLLKGLGTSNSKDSTYGGILDQDTHLAYGCPKTN